MIQITAGKETELKFQLNIEGSKKDPKVRLALNGGSSSILLEGKRDEKGVAKVVIPSSSFIESLSSQKVDAFLEVIVDNQYFTPWKGKIEFKEDVKVQAETEETEEGMEEEVTVTAEPEMMSEYDEEPEETEIDKEDVEEAAEGPEEPLHEETIREEPEEETKDETLPEYRTEVSADFVEAFVTGYYEEGMDAVKDSLGVLLSDVQDEAYSSQLDDMAEAVDLVFSGIFLEL